MGREILTNDRKRSAKAEVQDSELMENALSGQCIALPFRVTDETYIKVKGEWTYLYRAVDRDGKTLDFMLSERRNTAAATNFFARALSNNGLPLRIVIDKSGANGAGFSEVNKMLKRFGCPALSLLCLNRDHWRKLDDPTVRCRVINRDATLSQYFYQVTQ